MKNFYNRKIAEGEHVLYQIAQAVDSTKLSTEEDDRAHTHLQPSYDPQVYSSDTSPGLSASIPIPKNQTYIRPQHPKVFCDKCNIKPEGFRGPHELGRHMEHKHPPFRTVWICVDRSPDKKFLSKCKPCNEGKQYGAYYNAAAHLRRIHFVQKNPKPRGRGRGGDGGGANPPMEVLKTWIQEVSVPNDPQTQRSYETQNSPYHLENDTMGAAATAAAAAGNQLEMNILEGIPPPQMMPLTSAAILSQRRRRRNSQSGNTGDLHAPPPGTSAIQIGAAQHPQIHQTQTSQQPEQPSSPLYFHHWQPPHSRSKSESQRVDTERPSDNGLDQGMSLDPPAERSPTPERMSRLKSKERRRRPKAQATQGDAVLIGFMGGLNHPDLASKAGEEPLSQESDESMDEDDEEPTTKEGGDTFQLARNAFSMVERCDPRKDDQHHTSNNESAKPARLEIQTHTDPSATLHNFQPSQNSASPSHKRTYQPCVRQPTCSQNSQALLTA